LLPFHRFSESIITQSLSRLAGDNFPKGAIGPNNQARTMEPEDCGRNRAREDAPKTNIVALAIFDRSIRKQVQLPASAATLSRFFSIKSRL